MAARLHRQGLACHVLPKAEFRARMFEKLIWISAFMLVGAAHPGATVGDVEAKHKGQVTALIDEMAAGICKSDPSVKFGPALGERLCAYARSVAHFPTAVKEFEWRNGCASKAWLACIARVQLTLCCSLSLLSCGRPRTQTSTSSHKRRWPRAKQTRSPSTPPC